MCVCLILLCGCGTTLPEPKEYYELDDFKEVVINETSFFEVCELVPSPYEWLMATSYGYLCEYPMADGKCIHLKFDENDIVFKIEIAESLREHIKTNTTKHTGQKTGDQKTGDGSLC